MANSFFLFTDPRKSSKSVAELSADLHDLLESLLSEVWLLEKEWKLDDRINLAAKLARHSEDSK